MRVAINRNLTSTPPEAHFHLDQTGSEAEDEYWTGSYKADSLERHFSGNNLILSKTILIGGGNPNQEVRMDRTGVRMDQSQGTRMTFSCAYPLDPLSLMSHNDVIDNELLATRGAVGHLGYKIEFEKSENLIGQKTKFKIIPANQGLVFSRIRSCKMTHSSNPNLSYSLFQPIETQNSDQSEARLKRSALIGQKFCKDKFLNFEILSNFESRGIQEFSFTTFKWDSGMVCFILIGRNFDQSETSIQNLEKA